MLHLIFVCVTTITTSDCLQSVQITLTSTSYNSQSACLQAVLITHTILHATILYTALTTGLFTKSARLEAPFSKQLLIESFLLQHTTSALLVFFCYFSFEEKLYISCYFFFKEVILVCITFVKSNKRYVVLYYMLVLLLLLFISTYYFYF